MAHGAVTSTQQYNYVVIRKFAVMALVWGVLGMAAGLYAALELAYPLLNMGIAESPLGVSARCIPLW